jgi:hypothetical protein
VAGSNVFAKIVVTFVKLGLRVTLNKKAPMYETSVQIISLALMEFKIFRFLMARGR